MTKGMFLCGFLLAVLSLNQAQAANYNVANESQLDTALAAATNPGDTITLTADIALTTAKTMANAGVILQSDGNGPWTISGTDLSVWTVSGMITVTANDCTIQDLNIVEDGALDRHPVMVEADGFTIENCDVQSGDPDAGVSLGVFVGWFADRSNIAIQDCSFTNNTQHINLQDGNSNVTIDGCTFGAVPVSGAARTVVMAATGTDNFLMTNCVAAGAKMSVSAMTGSTATVEDCVFTSKQPANRELFDVNGAGTVNIQRCLIYGTAGDPTNPPASQANVIETQPTFTGTCNVDYCTIVHQDPNSRTAPAVRSRGGALSVINSIIHLTRTGQIGIRLDAGTATVDHSNVYTPAGAAVTSGTVTVGAGVINSYDLSRPWGSDHVAGDFLILNESRPSATASDTGGPIGYSSLFGGDNLLVNAGFEEGTAGWTNGGIDGIDNNYPTPGVAHEGDHWIGDSCSGSGVIQTPEIRQTVSCVPGATYLLSAWVHNDGSPNPCAMFLEWFDGTDPGDGAGTVVDSITESTSGWHPLSGTVVPTGDSLTFTIRVEYDCAGSGGGGNVDDCSLSLLFSPTGIGQWEMYR